MPSGPSARPSVRKPRSLAARPSEQCAPSLVRSLLPDKTVGLNKRAAKGRNGASGGEIFLLVGLRNSFLLLFRVLFEKLIEVSAADSKNFRRAHLVSAYVIQNALGRADARADRWTSRLRSRHRRLPPDSVRAPAGHARQSHPIASSCRNARSRSAVCVCCPARDSARARSAHVA